jgi:hypothetical protein
LTKDQAAELFCRSKRSIHRWQQDTPQHAVNLLIIKAGYLGALSEDWDGWRLFEGKLWTPGGWSITANEIMALPYQYSLIAEYRRLLGERPIEQDVLLTNVIPIRMPT